VSTIAPTPPLTYEQTTRVLARLAGVGDIVLVGGQAVNFWAGMYEDTTPELADNGPYTSKDIDFAGSKEAVQECAARLGGRARLATLDDHSPSTGLVLFVDEDGYERQIDFLGMVAGVEDKKVFDTSFLATILDENGQPASRFRVMHPEQCLESRLYNVAHLGYHHTHGLNQLRAAILCAREFAREREDYPTAKDLLRFNDRIISMARWGEGVLVYVRHGIDVMTAIVDADDLPEKFHTLRLPYAKEAVERARKKARAALARSAACALARVQSPPRAPS
jgi:hypothetical protein